METERMELSARERERLKVLQQVEEGHLKQVEAARRLRLSDRHVRRLQARLRREGDRGIVHRLRGDIEWIAAHSPQAKGRVERLFGTLQDRLVKEMRLAGIDTLEGANRFLEITFWPF